MTGPTSRNPNGESVGWHCPGCGGPPMDFGVPLDDQAFCANDECRTLMWRPSMTRAELAADTTVIDLPDLSAP